MASAPLTARPAVQNAAIQMFMNETLEVAGILSYLDRKDRWLDE
jgi:hypothetical protein